MCKLRAGMLGLRNDYRVGNAIMLCFPVPSLRQENYPPFSNPWNNEYDDPEHGYHAGLWGMQILDLRCLHQTCLGGAGAGHCLIKLDIAGKRTAESQQKKKKKKAAALRDFCCLKWDLKKKEKHSESVKIFGTVDKETTFSMETTSNILKSKHNYIVMYFSACSDFFQFFISDINIWSSCWTAWLPKNHWNRRVRLCVNNNDEVFDN